MAEEAAQILEKLSVQIIADTESFMKGVGQIKQGSDDIIKHLNAIKNNVDPIEASFTNLSNTISTLSASFATGVLGTLKDNLQGIATAFSGLQNFKVNTGFDTLSESLKGLTNVDMPKINTQLELLGKSVGTTALASDKVGKAATNLSALGGAMQALHRGITGEGLSEAVTTVSGSLKTLTESFDTSKLHLIKVQRTAGNIKDLGDAFAKLKADVGTDIVTTTANVQTALTNLGTGFGNFKGITPTRLDNLTKAIDGVVTNLPKLAALDLSGVATVAAQLPGVLNDIGSAFKDNKLGGTAKYLDNTLVRLESLSKSLARLTKVNPKNMGGASKGLKELFEANGGLNEMIAGSGLGNIDPVTVRTEKALVQLGNLGRAIRGLSMADPKLITEGIGAALNSVAQLAAMPVPAGMTQFNSISKGLETMGKALNSFGDVKGNKIAIVTSSLQTDLIPAMSQLAAIQNLPNAAASIDSVIKSMGSLSKFGAQTAGKTRLADINRVAYSLQNLAPALATINQMGQGGIALPNLDPLMAWLTKLTGVGPEMARSLYGLSKGFYRLAEGIKALGQADMSKAIANGNAMLAWVKQLGGLTPATTNNLNAVSRAFGNMAKMGAGGGTPPPVVNNWNNNAAAVPPAAGKATAATNRLATGFDRLGTSAMTSSMAMTYAKYSMIGFAGYSAFAFAQFDDTITRTLAHMQDFKQEFRSTLEHGFIDVINDSNLPVKQLGHALDILASSGMNAAMATRALGNVNVAAMAGNVDPGRMSQKLVDVQRTMGLASPDVETHHKNMKDIADIFVGLGPVVGSTTQQIMDAFGPKLTSVMRTFNIDMQQGAQLIGAYSLAGIKGAEASDMAARAIHELGRMSTDSMKAWGEMGVHVVNATGKFNRLDLIVGELAHVFAGMSASQILASEKLMGFETKSKTALIPLILMSQEMLNLTDDIKDFGGIAQKVADMLKTDFAFQLKMVQNQMTSLAILVGQTLAPAFFYLAQGIESLSKGFAALNPAIRNLIVVGAVAVVTFRPLMGLLGSTVGYLLSPLRTLAVALVNVGITALNMGMSVLRGLLWVGGGIVSVASTMVSFFTAPLKIIKSVAVGLYDVGKAIGGMFKDMASVGLSILMTVVGTLINLISTFFVLVTVGSVFLTLAVGIGQAFVAAGGLITGVWDRAKLSMDDFFQGASDKAIQLGKDIRDVWDNNKGGIQESLENAGRFFAKLAGFFWHFQDNMKVAFDWMDRNWDDIIKDLSQGFQVFGDNLIHNFVTVGKFLKDVFLGVGRFIWDTLSVVWRTTMSFLGENWAIMLENMGRAFVAFVTNVVKNIPAFIDLVVGAMTGDMLTRGQRSEVSDYRSESKEYYDKYMEFKAKSEGAKHPEYAAAQKALAYENWKQSKNLSDIADRKEAEYTKASVRKGLNLDNVKGPFDGADFKPLTEMPNTIGPTFQHVILPGLMDDLKKGWEGLKGLNTPLKGFEPITESLIDLFEKSGGLSLPEDWKKQVEKYTGKLMPQGLGGDESPMITGKQGPGFTYKQISQERYMIGGESAAYLDYQQIYLLQGINNKLELILRAQQNQAPPMIPIVGN